MLPLLSTSYIIREIAGLVLGGDGSPEFTDTLYTGETGEETGPFLPNNDSLAIGFKTGMSGRANRGRNFWPNLFEAWVVGSRVDNSHVDDILLAYADFLAGSTAPDSWAFVVLSAIPEVGETTGRSPEIISVSTADNVVDSMRRRLPKRGV